MASTTLTRPPQETMNARKERCERCRYWLQAPPEDAHALARASMTGPGRSFRPSDNPGHCRRYPPTYRSSFPLTLAADWCGEFRG